MSLIVTRYTNTAIVLGTFDNLADAVEDARYTVRRDNRKVSIYQSFPKWEVVRRITPDDVDTVSAS